ncbi:hypothetical protein [[Eubacterium] cellulosolvens]
MTLQHILYADEYTKKIAVETASKTDLRAEYFQIRNPTFNRWSSWLQEHKIGRKTLPKFLPSGSLLIGGNRWRHHFALNLTALPIVSIDAHTDMSFDEMIPLRLIRPYNWLYFRLLNQHDAHLILPYDSFRFRRWDMIVPERFLPNFYLYAFNRKEMQARVSLSVNRSHVLDVKNPESSPLLEKSPKQISLDLDITREVSEERVIRLLSKIAKEGDVCDVWLDEGKRGKRRTFYDDVETCIRIFKILNT